MKPFYFRYNGISGELPVIKAAAYNHDCIEFVNEDGTPFKRPIPEHNVEPKFHAPEPTIGSVWSNFVQSFLGIFKR